MTGKESPRSEGKGFCDGRNLTSGGKRCWQKVGVLAREGICEEKKMGGGKFPLPPFFKSFSSFVGEFRSQAYGVGSVPPISVILAPSLIVPPGPTP